MTLLPSWSKETMEAAPEVEDEMVWACGRTRPTEDQLSQQGALDCLEVVADDIPKGEYLPPLPSRALCLLATPHHTAIPSWCYQRLLFPHHDLDQNQDRDDEEYHLWWNEIPCLTNQKGCGVSAWRMFPVTTYDNDTSGYKLPTPLDEYPPDPWTTTNTTTTTTTTTNDWLAWSSAATSSTNSTSSGWTSNSRNLIIRPCFRQQQQRHPCLIPSSSVPMVEGYYQLDDGDSGTILYDDNNSSSNSTAVLVLTCVFVSVIVGVCCLGLYKYGWREGQARLNPSYTWQMLTNTVSGSHRNIHAGTRRPHPVPAAAPASAPTNLVLAASRK